jgi:hypothetical protein
MKKTSPCHNDATPAQTQGKPSYQHSNPMITSIMMQTQHKSSDQCLNPYITFMRMQTQGKPVTTVRNPELTFIYKMQTQHNPEQTQ